jgi:hypothetical protein
MIKESANYIFQRRALHVSSSTEILYSSLLRGVIIVVVVVVIIALAVSVVSVIVCYYIIAKRFGYKSEVINYTYPLFFTDRGEAFFLQSLEGCGVIPSERIFSENSTATTIYNYLRSILVPTITKRVPGQWWVISATHLASLLVRIDRNCFKEGDN